jgi:N-dimethylarginine dimethylaminohydrolase
MSVCSHNDWDPLEEVFVGRADSTMCPPKDISTHSFCYGGSSYEVVERLPERFDQKILDEATEDLDTLSDTLKKLNIKVHRPEKVDNSQSFSTPEWTSRGWTQFSPRDLLLPLNNIIIETPSPMRSRYFETRAYYKYLYEQMKDGTEWISAPKPILTDDNYQLGTPEDVTLRNNEIVFDAPNVVRMGRDILAQISNSGNHLGFEWLKTILEPRGYRIHIAEKFYSYSHFDSTILPLRPGLVLFNSDRLSPDRYPEIFKSWDKIWFGGDQIKVSEHHSPNGVSPCSTAIGLNFLSVNPNLVICDIVQDELRRELAKYKIETIGLPMRHSRTLSGGFHCVTLDVKRKGTLENYF